VNLDLKRIPIYILNRDGGQQSRELIARFQSNRYFHVVRMAHDDESIARALDSGDAKMGLVIPWDFSMRLEGGRPAQVQALVDATDDNTANILMGYTQAVVQGYHTQVQLDWLARRGLAIESAPLRVELRTWFNEELESSVFIVPGVLALVMSVIGAFLTSLTIAREWERGTMEQLISTPVTAGEIMLGKLAPYFVLGMIDVAICAVLAIAWFHTPFRGSYLTLAFSSAMFMVVVLSLGFLISVVAKNQFAASQLALLITFLPAFLLSGFLFAIDQMPRVLQWITCLVPARYYMAILKKVFLKGSGVSLLAADLIPLAVFTVILAFAATRAFHKRLD
jgi:ABC-2 type transport system permease protein